MPAIASRHADEPGTRGGSAPRVRALVVDDEPNIRATLALCLRQLGCDATEAATGAAAVAALEERAHDVAFLDLRLGSEDGLEVLPRLLALRPGLEVVIITAYSSFDSAVEAMRLGARDYLPKPFTPSQIRHVVERLRARRGAGAPGEAGAPVPRLETASRKMRAAVALVAGAAAHDVPVLLRGEPGTGKGALARAVHAQSARRDRAFLVVSCPTAAEDRLAVEVFGAAGGLPGRLEAAEGGTVFFEEIGELPPALQARLVRFLQERALERVGEAFTRRADVRVVASSERDLEADVRGGRFRRDLLYRLNVMEIVVPPLRERPEDLLPLARGFVEHFAARAGRTAPALSPGTERLLAGWSWPGNVRELRNAVERALILTSGDVVLPEVLPERMLGGAGGGPVPGGDFTAEELEREHVLRVVARAPTLAEASRILGVDVTTLWRKRKKWGR